MCYGNLTSLVASKLSKSIGIIHKSRFFLSTQSLRTLYNSMILPYLYYCNLAWGGTYKTDLQRIVILQKRALRIVNNSTYDANTSPIFKELKLLKFHDIHLNVGHGDGDDNEDSRAIDIHEIHRQCRSVYRGHLQGSGALSVDYHCLHVVCGLLDARGRWKRDCRDEGVPAMLATLTPLRFG